MDGVARRGCTERASTSLSTDRRLRAPAAPLNPSCLASACTPDQVVVRWWGADDASPVELRPDCVRGIDPVVAGSANALPPCPRTRPCGAHRVGSGQHTGASPTATFPVVSGRDKLVRYLRDMEALELEVHTDRLLGVATLGEDLASAVDLDYPYQRDVPVLGPAPPPRRPAAAVFARAHCAEGLPLDMQIRTCARRWRCSPSAPRTSRRLRHPPSQGSVLALMPPRPHGRRSRRWQRPARVLSQRLPDSVRGSLTHTLRSPVHPLIPAGTVVPCAVMLALGWLRVPRESNAHVSGPYYAVCRLPRHDTWTSPVCHGPPLKKRAVIRTDRARRLRHWACQPYDLDASGGAANLAVQVRLPLTEADWRALAGHARGPPEAVVELWRGQPGGLGHLYGTCNLRVTSN